ncbi:bifunctional biotin--[acetyl-CoA-carboxylase] ligase/biotin operon repressor BirA [Paraglaciecola aestuariivivens]
MSQSTELIRGTLLTILADNQFHSGEILGEKLGISRASISNHVKVLSALGLDIYSVTGKGYRLAQPLNLLKLELIEQGLSKPPAEHIEVLNVIGSTNQYLKDKLGDLAQGHCCLAEAQTAGRGRHGRKWVSPYSASLYLSMYWSFAGGYAALGGLSLAVGVALVQALNQLGIQDVQLKWPNDIYAQGKKLAGVLIEVEGQMGSGCEAIIGVGLNVALPDKITEIDQAWTDLTRICQNKVDRNQLAGAIIERLRASVSTFEEQGLEPFIQAWQALDVYAQQEIKLIMGKQTIYGINRGIDATGALLLETEQGIKAFHGGEISVRPA